MEIYAKIRMEALFYAKIIWRLPVLACTLTNKHFFSLFNIIALKVFLAVSEFVGGNIEPCRWKFDRIMLRSISKQQK